MFELKEEIEIIKEIENKKNLFQKKIKNIYFWKIIRFNLFSEIVKKKCRTNEAHDLISKTNKLKYLLKWCIYNTLKNNVLKKEIIIFDHNRFFHENNCYKSIYTFDLIKKLEKKKITYEIIYPNFTNDKIKNKNVHRIENLNYIFIKILYLLKRKISKLSLNDKEFLIKLKKELEEKFKIEKIGLLEENNILKELYNFEAGYQYYKKYFRIKSPQKIYLICSYGREAIIVAAQELGIEVIELQHGVFTKYHIGYSFPIIKVPYFPNKFFIFGEYWKKDEFLPINTESIIYGYPYLRNQLERYKNIEKKKNQVIFISQGPIGKKLSKKATEFAKDNPSIKVVYRLHPGEFLRWKTEYKELYENRELENLKISDNNEKNLYEYLFESEYLIGVNSTVIYEALEIELKIGIIKLFGYEYVEDLINDNIIHAFNENERINLKVLDNLKKVEKGYFFK